MDSRFSRSGGPHQISLNNNIPSVFSLVYLAHSSQKQNEEKNNKVKPKSLLLISSIQILLFWREFFNLELPAYPGILFRSEQVLLSVSWLKK